MRKFSSKNLASVMLMWKAELWLIFREPKEGRLAKIRDK